MPENKNGFMGGMTMNRRQFVKMIGGAAVTVNIIPITSVFASDGGGTQPSQGFEGWQKKPGEARYRIDGLAKVTGQKIYARDFRARDFQGEGWPVKEASIQIMRATDVDHIFETLDLDILPPELRPEVIYAEDVNLDLPSTITFPLLVPQGQRADYYGQPVAFLFFKTAYQMRKAQYYIEFNEDFIKYGAKDTDPRICPDNPKEFKDLDGHCLYAPLTNYVRIAADGPKDVFSYAKNGGDSDYTKKSEEYRRQIKLDIRSSDWNVYDLEADMPAMDPVFMEPESGIAWYDQKTKTLNMVLGTQSPDGDVTEVLSMLENSQSPIKPTTVNLISCYPGGGFGGRDKSMFTINLAIAAAYANGQPVRLAYNRYEQFQSGLKRHACDLKETLAVDSDGKIQAMTTEMVFDGGGRRNLSPYVASLAGLCAGGGYEIPRSAIKTHAKYTTNIPGGSQRGFGGPQAFFAIESALDEAAVNLQLSPFEIRRRNIMRQGSRTVVGGPVSQKPRFDEIIDQAEKHPIWTKREEKRKAYAKEGLDYGVGFAISNQAYGTSGDGVVGQVILNTDGTLSVSSSYVDMGNGSATTLAVATAKHLGANADNINMGDAELWPSMGMTTDPSYTWDDNKKYTASSVGSSSACLCAFHQVHAVEQASLVLLELAILPVAEKHWGLEKGSLKADSVTWQDGYLKTKDGSQPPIAREKLISTVHKLGGITGILVHAYFREIWVNSEFNISNQEYNWDIDGLSVYYSGTNPDEPPAPIWRKGVNKTPSPESGRYSRTRFAPCGNLMGVTVDRKTGVVTVVDSLSVLNAGPIITEGLVSGQSQGGVAMAIGYSLLEDIKPGSEGPADGRWNLDRYHVALSRDIALHSQELKVLDPLDRHEKSNGIAEAVMCSVAPAISNAIYDASQIRMRSLPFTSSKIMEALKS
ncbi:xanthine dehydrogenase family protein molybdopterin-binding subunit [Curvivirga aplysinae]|uniref:xanthine dehydrogenase family protein molybdopterin-binding subunit n=1 Tax=Curvivirga aplysinae TaxID=2529852 RepID=UPI0012BC9B07|nr:molybdopterin cofactor-binding domain-containing protein [Curvivirga aplysinae]MTI08357.1 xanthine dehydrogenase family protein molybdopterin-binding subunit [Curvivirga aplysinae]